MLARSPIRTKLLIVLAILSCMIATLAFSGFWGLYRYRQLAHSISRRASEIPQTNQLIRSVETLRDCCHCVEDIRYRRNSFGTENQLSQSILHTESKRFDDALLEFQSVLGRYRDSLKAAGDEDALLVDRAQQQLLLQEMDATLAEIQSLQHRPLAELSSLDFASLQLELDGLYEQTTRLPTFLQQRMVGVRDEARGQYRGWITVAWLCTVLTLGLLFALLWLFRNLIVLPFNNLLEGCRLVAQGSLSHHIDLGTGDELDELGRAMNDMTERFRRTNDQLRVANADLAALCADLDRQVRERTREVIQGEQLASVGFLAAGVAHEINNPLASIAMSAEAIESRLHDILVAGNSLRSLSQDEAGALRDNLSRIQDQAFRCKGITEKLLDFSRLGNVTVEPTDLGELTEDVVSMVRTLGQYRCKTIRCRCPSNAIAPVNAQEIRQVVLNLLTNALESVSADGAVEVEVTTDDQHARIIVRDNGCGMTEEVREHLFEPFFTRRQDGRGTGLGLSITYRIVSKHGGQITAASPGVGGGSEFLVKLPLEAAPENAPPLAPPFHSEAYSVAPVEVTHDTRNVA